MSQDLESSSSSEATVTEILVKPDHVHAPSPKTGLDWVLIAIPILLSLVALYSNLGNFNLAKTKDKRSKRTPRIKGFDGNVDAHRASLLADLSAFETSSRSIQTTTGTRRQEAVDALDAIVGQKCSDFIQTFGVMRTGYEDWMIIDEDHPFPEDLNTQLVDCVFEKLTDLKNIKVDDVDEKYIIQKVTAALEALKEAREALKRFKADCRPREI